MKAKLPASWREVLRDERAKPYLRELYDFLEQEYRTCRVFPPEEKIFRAFELCPFDEVRVVLVGQDPYHGEGQADGLAFSVPEGIPYPPSLQNIVTEARNSLGEKFRISSDLSPWAKKGMLLLNTTLSVRSGQPLSHFGHGWETFTSSVIAKLSAEKQGLIFILWGANARKLKHLIDPVRHRILEAAHPSPLSANRGGFFGCGHFKEIEHIIC